MHCPFCHHPDSRVVDTRIAEDGACIRRRRECPKCKRRFTTIETSSFQVAKTSGTIEPFSRDKVIAGVRKACQGRPVSEHDLAYLAQQVEESLRLSGVSSVSSKEVGKAILPYLSRLDEVAFLRFASVYQAYDNLEDFEKAIVELRDQRDQGADEGREQSHSAKKDPLPTREARVISQEKGTLLPEHSKDTVTQTEPEITPKVNRSIKRSAAQKRSPRKRAPIVEEPTLLDT